MIRVELPFHLRTLARVGGEVQIEVEGPVTFESWRADSIYFSDPDDHRVELCGFEHLNGREPSGDGA